MYSNTYKYVQSRAKVFVFTKKFSHFENFNYIKYLYTDYYYYRVFLENKTIQNKIIKIYHMNKKNCRKNCIVFHK